MSDNANYDEQDQEDRIMKWPKCLRSNKNISWLSKKLSLSQNKAKIKMGRLF